MVQGRACQLAQEGTWRLQAAERLRAEHAEYARAAREARRARMAAAAQQEASKALSALVVDHNRGEIIIKNICYASSVYSVHTIFFFYSLYYFIQISSIIL